MKAILDLNVIPELSDPAASLEELKALRSLPMKGERQTVWCIQNGEDISSRQALPGFISAHIAKKVATWASANGKWEEMIYQRGLVGKNLTPASEKKYQEWVEENKEQRLLFSKSAERLVTKINGKMSAAKIQKEYFSIQINMSTDPEQLSIKAGSGEARRLLLLRGEPVETDLFPKFLGGVSEAVATALASGQLKDHEEEANDSCSDGPVDLEAREAEIAEMAVTAENAVLEAEEKETFAEEWEILGFSDEEEEVKNLLPGHGHRVKSFMHREAYQKLEGYGVTALPMACSAHLAYHSTSRTWQGYFKGSSVGLTYTHGGSTHRSEAEALLKAIKGIIEKYVMDYPRDRLWRSQLTKVQDVEAKVDHL